MTWITKQIMKQQMIKSSKEKNTQKHKFFSIFDILKVLKKKKILGKNIMIDTLLQTQPIDRNYFKSQACDLTIESEDDENMQNNG